MTLVMQFFGPYNAAFLISNFLAINKNVYTANYIVTQSKRDKNSAVKKTKNLFAFP